MSPIEVQSPTRVDLAGGTLDLWPLYLFLGEAWTVNVAIDIWTGARIEEWPRFCIESRDFSETFEFDSLEELKRNSKYSLFYHQFNFWKPSSPLKVTTYSQSPVGGGLGGSSSLTISLMKAFSQWMQKPLSEVRNLVAVAHNIEAQILKTPTGQQDYFPAASGGLNILHFHAGGIDQQVLEIPDLLADHFVLAYTGRSHHSGINNFDVFKKVVEGDKKTLTALTEIGQISRDLCEILKQGTWNELPILFEREYQSRIALSEHFSSLEIEKIRSISLQAGAKAVKICGAGGGGCVLIWCPPPNRQKVISACEENGFQVLRSQPVGPLKNARLPVFPA